MKRIEKQVCEQLKTWFERYKLKCWMNEGENKFTTRGIKRKPDLIIFSDITKQYIAIEVKKGDKQREIYEASKIIDYWQDYVEKKTTYHIEDKQIEISSFAVATIYSMFGRLFKDEKIELFSEIKDDKWQIVNKKYRLEPLNEFKKTKIYLRNLWSNWRRIRTSEENPGLGIIVSDCLNQEKFIGTISRPILFDQQREYINQKMQWKVRQKWI